MFGVISGVMGVVPMAYGGCEGLTCRGLGSVGGQFGQGGGLRCKGQTGRSETSVAKRMKIS